MSSSSKSSGPVLLKASQLDKFSSINTGAITLTSGGAVDLTDATGTTSTINLNAAGNTLNLGGLSSFFCTVNGAGGNDIIIGGDSGDKLHGGAGSDTLDGGFGNDNLYGEAGPDKFLFDTHLDLGSANNVDTVTTFSEIDHDKILLDNAVFTALGATGILAPAKFSIDIATIAATALSDQFPPAACITIPTEPAPRYRRYLPSCRDCPI